MPLFRLATVGTIRSFGCKNMQETHDFLVPDYFFSFSCKMGGCRAACCEGWPISISMQNYFYLLGIDCKRSLRERLDCGMRMVEHPTEEEYARFNPRYDGDCPLRMEDGRCALQAELGEGVLPDVCRLYPRGIRVEDGLYECSCANSCEAVLELLFKQKEPIKFSFRRLTFHMPEIPNRTSFFETMGMEQKIRMHFIEIIQDRRLLLPQRIMRLGGVLDRMDVALESRDRAMLDRIMQETPTSNAVSEGNMEAESLQFGLKIAEHMIELLDAHSQSIRACGKAALQYFGSGEDALPRYFAAKSHFEQLFPNWEVFYEHMLVNHMFFSQFPFQDRPESMHSEQVALCAVYTLLRFLGLGCMAERESASDLIDVMSAAFRLIGHTEFDRYAAHMLKKMKSADSESLYRLISL